VQNNQVVIFLFFRRFSIRLQAAWAKDFAARFCESITGIDFQPIKPVYINYPEPDSSGKSLVA
jgi:hypothetical protein